jgi:hypothetical protein
MLIIVTGRSLFHPVFVCFWSASSVYFAAGPTGRQGRNYVVHWNM